MKDIERIEKTISTLIDNVSADESVKKILLNLQILNHYLNNDELSKWLKYESEGYPNKEQLPEYRTTDALVYVAGGTYGGRFSGVNIPVETIKDVETRGVLNKMDFLQPIGELEDLCTSDEKSTGIMMHLPLWTYSVLSTFMQPGYEIDQAHKKASRSMVLNIVYVFKSKVLALLLQLNKELDLELDFNTQTLKINEMIEKNIPATIVANHSTVTITGEHVAVGNKNSIHVEGAKLDDVKKVISQLEEAINSSDVPEEVMEYLMQAKEAAQDEKKQSVVKMAFTALKTFVADLPEVAGPLIQTGLNLLS